ncbi:ABC transporter ATP-binding protein [Pistricoccus aurantiacus]|uniref:ABC transporter ATP-binding protein n=1 Tax=Pistricoccus aurantiacus TaxID=1883414 RepID=A0A5B8SXN4_9GAMM|nr:ABC transporter ATP-binding protein [Pistricoccus aurantiacus]QEA39583.1 ABC transporter ATP-binding protein [Pistricoccus aurantiacus]
MGRLCTHSLVLAIPGRLDVMPLELSIEPGQRWGVLGPNGAGKTTLLHTLAGLLSPRQGRVTLNGKPLKAWRRRSLARELGILFQQPQDGYPASVMESVLIGRHPYLTFFQQESAEDIERAQQAMERLDIAHLDARLVSTLSGGERQRVAIATLLTQSPALWLVDEPTNHLDLHHRVAVMRLLSEQAEQGRAVVMCLHDLNLAARWCDHLLLLYPNGEACWGPAKDMLVTGALERLYNQRLSVGDIDGARVFMPRA